MMNLFSISQNNLTVTTNITYEISGSRAAGNNITGFLAQAKIAWIDFGTSMVDYFKSYQFKELLFTLKTISFIISLILLGIIIYIFIKSSTFKKTTKLVQKIKKKKTQKVWMKIIRRLNSGIEANHKLAILEADRLYDESLKILGYDKEKTLNNLDKIKKAKKIKNHIIDDSNFKLTAEDAVYGLIAYKKGLEELGIL